MGELDERHVVDHPDTGHRRVRSRPPRRSRRRIGGAAGLVAALVLGTATLGAFPTPVRSVGTVRAAEIAPLPVGSVAGVVDAVSPGVLLPVPPVPPAPQTVLAPPTGGAQAPVETRPAPFTSALPDQRAQVAIRTAMAQIGLPYVWGGDGPTNGDAGFDCSGLTAFSYAAAGVGLPRTAHTQYYTGPHVPAGAALQPGDLVFYGTPAFVHHVGMYLGDGKMVNAPTFGKPVQVAYYRWGGDDYLGATRPAATGTTTGLLPYAPPAAAPAQPRDFPAPVAPAPTVEPVATAVQPAEAVSAAQASAAAATVTVTVQATSVPTTTVPTTTAPTTTAPRTTSAAPTSSSAKAVTTRATTTSRAATSSTRATTTTTSAPVTTHSSTADTATSRSGSGPTPADGAADVKVTTDATSQSDHAVSATSATADGDGG